MIVSLTIVRYRRLFIPFALLAMAIHRLPLLLNKKCSFWKLLGCGKNGSFDLQPGWQQWGLLAVWPGVDDFHDFDHNSFIGWWWKTFTSEKWTVIGVPIASHGKWDGKDPFEGHSASSDHKGVVAVLTRASIRSSKITAFWSSVKPVAGVMASAPGLIASVGIGEAPIFRQATFSVWEDMESMRAFAYESTEHLDVIRRTRTNNWYSEELFARFKVISSSGTMNGINPLTIQNR